MNIIHQDGLDVAEFAVSVGVKADKIHKWRRRKVKKLDFLDGLRILRARGMDICPIDKVNLASVEPGPYATLTELVRFRLELNKLAQKIDERIEAKAEGKGNGVTLET